MKSKQSTKRTSAILGVTAIALALSIPSAFAASKTVEALLRQVELNQGTFNNKGANNSPVSPYQSLSELYQDLGLDENGVGTPNLATVAADPAKWAYFIEHLSEIPAEYLPAFAQDPAINSQALGQSFYSALQTSNNDFYNPANLAAQNFLYRVLDTDDPLNAFRTTLDLRGKNFNSKGNQLSFAGANLSGMQITGDQLNINPPSFGAATWAGANLSGLDLSGWNPPSSTSMSLLSPVDPYIYPLGTWQGYGSGFGPSTDFTNVNLSGATNIPIGSLCTAAGLAGANLTGTGITKQQFIDQQLLHFPGPFEYPPYPPSIDKPTYQGALDYATARANSMIFDP